MVGESPRVEALDKGDCLDSAAAGDTVVGVEAVRVQDFDVDLDGSHLPLEEDIHLFADDLERAAAGAVLLLTFVDLWRIEKS